MTTTTTTSTPTASRTSAPAPALASSHALRRVASNTSHRPSRRPSRRPSQRLRRPLTSPRHLLRVAAAGLVLLFPEIAVGMLLFDAAKAAQLERIEGTDPERGDAIQWVIVTAIGAAIAVTVGAIIFNKLESKANNIDVTTPGAR